MIPDSKLEAEEKEAEERRHNLLISKLSEVDKAEVISKARKLLDKQNTEEDISCLPCLQLSDIPTEGIPEPFVETLSTFRIQIHSSLDY
ncbi:unnamed protein product [Protopolystoma xenopodis]|uniref:Peptidase M16C associated domain-containing protein n=1 Tax=Protopolystoma xenopodis TaxID=117903 RepID=A0A448WUX2_9PLAT|nr:unnamed protein product [Protopolystoma xenopodis]